MTREHRSDVAEIDADITEAITVLREALGPMEGSVEDRALCTVEQFIKTRTCRIVVRPAAEKETA